MSWLCLAESCVQKARGVQRLYVRLHGCDPLAAHHLQRGSGLHQPGLLPVQAHLLVLLHTSSKTQVLLRLDAW